MELNHSKQDTIKQEINRLHENLYTKFEWYNSIKQGKNCKNVVPKSMNNGSFHDKSTHAQDFHSTQCN